MSLLRREPALIILKRLHTIIMDYAEWVKNFALTDIVVYGFGRGPQLLDLERFSPCVTCLGIVTTSAHSRKETLDYQSLFMGQRQAPGTFTE